MKNAFKKIVITDYENPHFRPSHRIWKELQWEGSLFLKMPNELFWKRRSRMKVFSLKEEVEIDTCRQFLQGQADDISSGIILPNAWGIEVVIYPNTKWGEIIFELLKVGNINLYGIDGWLNYRWFTSQTRLVPAISMSEKIRGLPLSYDFWSRNMYSDDKLHKGALIFCFELENKKFYL